MSSQQVFQQLIQRFQQMRKKFHWVAIIIIVFQRFVKFFSNAFYQHLQRVAEQLFSMVLLNAVA